MGVFPRFWFYIKTIIWPGRGAKETTNKYQVCQLIVQLHLKCLNSALKCKQCFL